MDWIKRLNSAMNYIEENITDSMDMENVSKIAGCSSYHFQRMFVYMTEVPISEYIRKRKMSLAAVDIMNGEKVIDVAIKYGYESPTAFNRAFKSIHNIAPSKMKEDGVVVKAFPPIHFQISIKGDSEMNYRIIKKEAFKIIGISAPLEKELEKNFQIVPKMWGKCATDGTIPALLPFMDTDLKGLLGVSSCNKETDWKYYIAVATTKETPEQFDELQIPACTWAVFSGEGKNTAIQELEARIVREWLPTSGYEYANAPDIEVYLNPDPENATFEVWIPVIRK
ncbi:MAG: GyrI-like domain-containing protein [Velocimicrobium sp.]